MRVYDDIMIVILSWYVESESIHYSLIPLPVVKTTSPRRTDPRSLAWHSCWSKPSNVSFRAMLVHTYTYAGFSPILLPLTKSSPITRRHESRSLL